MKKDLKRRGRYNEPGKTDVYGISEKVIRQIRKVKDKENR